MLVIHWAKQNQTSDILANGIRPAFRHGPGGVRRNAKGVYVFPFSPNRTLRGNWRRLLKGSSSLGNRNGFVFRLTHEDFPLLAGYWQNIRTDPQASVIASPEELAATLGVWFSGAADNPWTDIEIIIPRHIHPKRILKVIRDRQPGRRRRPDDDF